MGQSSKIERRLTRHKMWLRQNEHFSQELQDDWNKYGEEYFFIKIIEKSKHLAERDRIEKEEKWINFYRNNGAFAVYNLRYKGHHISEEGLRRISEASKKMAGENHPMWGKTGYWNGKKRPDTFGKKISEALKGHTVSEEARRKMAEAKLGKEPPNKFPLTPELLGDIKNGISYKDFVSKYGQSINTLKRIKRELKTKDLL